MDLSIKEKAIFLVVARNDLDVGIVQSIVVKRAKGLSEFRDYSPQSRTRIIYRTLDKLKAKGLINERDGVIKLTEKGLHYYAELKQMDFETRYQVLLGEHVQKLPYSDTGKLDKKRGGVRTNFDGVKISNKRTRYYPDKYRRDKELRRLAFETRRALLSFRVDSLDLEEALHKLAFLKNFLIPGHNPLKHKLSDLDYTYLHDRFTSYLHAVKSHVLVVDMVERKLLGRFKYVEDREGNKRLLDSSIEALILSDRERYRVLPYAVRWNVQDPNVILRLGQGKVLRVWNQAIQEERERAIFLTITFPPLPLIINRYLASYVFKRIMQRIQRHLQKNNAPKPLYVKSNEFQDSGQIHLHIVIFGLGRFDHEWLIPRQLKREFTEFAKRRGLQQDDLSWASLTWILGKFYEEALMNLDSILLHPVRTLKYRIKNANGEAKKRIEARLNAYEKLRPYLKTLSRLLLSFYHSYVSSINKRNAKRGKGPLFGLINAVYSMKLKAKVEYQTSGASYRKEVKDYSWVNAPPGAEAVSPKPYLLKYILKAILKLQEYARTGSSESLKNEKGHDLLALYWAFRMPFVYTSRRSSVIHRREHQED
ncbi:hypothetical protein [Metallosphaera sedula]|uniref:hypothetical protein n=1 Tax=Metallosphaera sedula TaxID=43687 RepID=UPI0020BF1461|nr:hypothetical protein [Metallosphaera sedula]BBL47848.1 hypothetical protein MJ1HA_1958 [Metallosphaera sedula]